MIEQMWRSILAPDEMGEPLVASHEVDDVVALMIEYKIDPQKFAGNLAALITNGMPSLGDVLGGGGKKDTKCLFSAPNQVWIKGLASTKKTLSVFFQRARDARTVRAARSRRRCSSLGSHFSPFGGNFRRRRPARDTSIVC